MSWIEQLNKQISPILKSKNPYLRDYELEKQKYNDHQNAQQNLAKRANEALKQK